MNYFLNLKNGEVSINTYRLADAQVTDVLDIVSAKHNDTGETLTASLDLFIEEEAQKIYSTAETCKTVEQLWGFIFGEGDFLETTLERGLGLSISDYPDLRDLQKCQFSDIEDAIISKQ